ncbi:hypothetical protein [Micromonospora palomenae]|uniref:hypothetical protein n=1 Tax=Micromonospora palomenae TaxID=1461247 RepID=UPI003F8C9507
MIFWNGHARLLPHQASVYANRLNPNTLTTLPGPWYVRRLFLYVLTFMAQNEQTWA